MLETGEPLLLRLVPGDGEGGDQSEAIEGAVVERNPCLSGGSLEIFLEPHLPEPRLLLVGASPIAKALAQVAAAAGYDCVRADSGSAGLTDDVAGAAAVVVASHGSGEEAVLAAALSAGVPLRGPRRQPQARHGRASRAGGPRRAQGPTPHAGGAQHRGGDPGRDRDLDPRRADCRATCPSRRGAAAAPSPATGRPMPQPSQWSLSTRCAG